MFDRARFLAILAGAAGGAIAIASMEAFSITAAFPLVAIPFATSIHGIGLAESRAGTAARSSWRSSRFHAGWPAHRQAMRTSSMGCCPGGWSGNGRNAPDWYVSSACRNRSSCRGRQRHVMELPFCAGWHWRAAAHTVCLRLAQPGRARCQ